MKIETEDAMDEISDKMTVELEAAAFRRLVEHFDNRKDVQNIDLMNLAGFCRNCLSKWYRAAAEDRGLEISYEEAREIVYGIPYSEWKDLYQNEVSQGRQKEFVKAAARTEKEEKSRDTVG
jgi:hypothetical protein